MKDVSVLSQVKTINANCNGLKRDCVKAQEIAKNETQMRQHLEDQLLKYRKETGKTLSITWRMKKLEFLTLHKLIQLSIADSEL